MTDERDGFRRYCATCVNWKRRHNDCHGDCPIVGYARHAAAIPCRAYEDNPELVKPGMVTEEVAEHRVMILHSSTNFRRFGVSGREVPGALLSEDNCKQIFGTSEEGAEVATRVLSRPEPEPERVTPRIRRLRAVVQCPECEQDMAVDEGDCMPTACSACGVHFKEVPDG